MIKVSNKPKKLLEFLSNDEVIKIHEQSLKLLKDVGVKVEDDEVLVMLNEAGAKIDKNKKIAKFPLGLVSDCLKSTPSKASLYSRNPENTLILNDKYSYTRTNSGALHIYDWEKKKHRKANLDDVKKIVKLVDSLDAVSTNEAVVDPQEIPHNLRGLYTVRVLIESEKHILYPPSNIVVGEALIEMASVITNGTCELRKKPIISFNGGISSPLHYDKMGIGLLRKFANLGIPCLVGTGQISGGLSPVTLAGTIMQANSEALAGLVIVQIINPGTPVIFGAHPNLLDMKTGVCVMASPEVALMTIAVAQIARYYNLPSWTYLGTTNSKIPDMQAGYDKMLTAILCAMAGIDIYGAAGNLGAALITSYETLLIDNEIFEMCNRILEGITINSDTLAGDVIAEVGPAGNFLNHVHTFKHFKKEHWVPTISERYSLVGWMKHESKDAIQRAGERVEILLKEYKPLQLDEDKIKELDLILEKYKNIILSNN